MFWGCKDRVTREKANEPKKMEINKKIRMQWLVDNLIEHLS